MPHVDIKCYAGRTDEQKRECAGQIVEVIAKTLGCETKSVSVAIKDVEQSAWKKEVWDKHIIPNFSLTKRLKARMNLKFLKNLAFATNSSTM